LDSLKDNLKILSYLYSPLQDRQTLALIFELSKAKIFFLYYFKLNNNIIHIVIIKMNEDFHLRIKENSSNLKLN